MDLIDVNALKGKRVWIETEPVDDGEGHAYVGTLTKINEQNIALKNWIRVDEWDASHICVYTNGREIHDSWNGELFLCTVGFLREVRIIELNLKKGDPHVE